MNGGNLGLAGTCGEIDTPLQADEAATASGLQHVGYPTPEPGSQAQRRGYHGGVVKAPLIICAAVLAVSLVALVLSRSWLTLVAVVVAACCLTVAYGMYERGRR